MRFGTSAIVSLFVAGAIGGGSFAYVAMKPVRERIAAKRNSEKTVPPEPVPEPKEKPPTLAEVTPTPPPKPKEEPGKTAPSTPEASAKVADDKSGVPMPPGPEKPPEVVPAPRSAESGDFRLTQRVEAKVQAVYFLKSPSGVSGGTSPLTIRAEGNDSGHARIGLKREMLSGTGQMWDGSVWVAAFVASQSLGQSVIDNEFEVISSGSIDGPSAGMLITVTMTALMTGEKLIPDTTMTGTVNPDGTCGPVGGIIQKLEGAAKAGIKRFGFPAGNRLIHDPNKNELVDVKERASQLGIEIEEISTLQDAYKFFTGKPHPAWNESDRGSRRPPAVDVSLLGRLRNSREQIAGKSIRVMEAAAPSMEALDPANKAALEERMQEIRAALKEAEIKERNGSFALAIYQTANALASSSRVEIDLRVIQASGKGGYLGAIEELVKIHEAITAERNTLGTKVKGYLTTKDLGMRIDALSLAAMLQEVEIQQVAALHALKVVEEAVRSKSTDPKAKERQNRLINQISGMLAYAKGRLESAESWQIISNSTGKAEIPTGHEFFDQQGKGYALAAESSLELLKSVASDSWRAASVQRFGESSVAYPDFVWAVEPSFHASEIAARLTLNRRMSIARATPPEGGALVPEGEQEGASIDIFGSGIYAYLEVSKMILAWYNFPEIRAHAVDGTAYSVAFGNFLEAARDNAAAKAAKAEAVCGKMPESILLNLHLGMQLSNGSTDEKMASFVAFWKTSLYSDLVIAAAKSARKADTKNVEEPRSRGQCSREMSIPSNSKILVVACLVVSLAGCENMNTGAAAGIGGVVGGVIGHRIDGNRGAVIGALGGAALGAVFAESYNASQAQRREAERLAAVYSRKPSAVKTTKARKTKYIAVPVKSEKKSKGKDVVLVNQETGKAESEAYVPKAGESFSTGEVVTVGGKEAVVGNSFQGI